MAKRKSGCRRKNIYITPQATRLKNKKDKLWKIYKAVINYSNFTRTKNHLRSLTRSLRYNFEVSIAANCKTKPKQFWAYSNSKLKTKVKIPTLKDDQGYLAKTDQEKAAMLNILFRSVFTIEDLSLIPTLDIEFHGRPLCTIKFLVGLVRTKLRSFKLDKAPGPDSIHPYLLRKLANSLCHPLSILFTKSLEE